MKRHGRGVLITGASSGIGFAVAERFLELGDRVFITGRDHERLEEARISLAQNGGILSAAAASLDSPADVDRLTAHALAQLGRVDVLINNAGIAIDAPFLETSDELWNEHFAVNVSAPFRIARRLAGDMARSGRGGVIVNTSSIDSVASEVGLSAYAASKAALESLTRSMALELAPSGIRANCVSPGWIKTPIYARSGATQKQIEEYFSSVIERVPLGRAAEPAEIAGVFVFLASEDAAYITGANIVVDGGRLAT